MVETHGSRESHRTLDDWGPLADGRALVERIVDLEFELEAVRQPTPSAPSTSSDTGRL